MDWDDYFKKVERNNRAIEHFGNAIGGAIFIALVLWWVL
jgi:hypothetical protein